MTASPTPPPPAQLSQLLFTLATGGPAMSSLVRLRIPDLLRDGPRSAKELAKEASVQPRPLYRVLRAATVLGVLEEQPGQRFALTPTGTLLRSDVPGSMRDMVLYATLPAMQHVREEMLHSVRTGEPAFPHVHGAPMFDYFAQHPAEAALFDAAMTSNSAGQAAAVADAYEFRGARTVVDVAGGQGKLLATVLRRDPAMRGVLLDLPHVVKEAAATLAKEGVADRVQVVAGDMFRDIPKGGDVYLLKHIIHDWDDARSEAILRGVRAAMGPTARVLVIEMVIPGPGVPHIGKLLDLQMLTGPGGEERTAEEYEALLARAGLKLSRILPTASPLSIIEAVPN